MAANIDPVVRNMVLCRDVRLNPTNPLDSDILGLITYVRPVAPARFPVELDQLCVYLQLTGGRGSGNAQVVTLFADTGEAIFATSVRRIDHPPDPLVVKPYVFRIRQCRFPRPGLYWVVFRYNGRELSERELFVR
jgi:hypothetical protein